MQQIIRAYQLNLISLIIVLFKILKFVFKYESIDNSVVKSEIFKSIPRKSIPCSVELAKDIATDLNEFIIELFISIKNTLGCVP